MADPESRARILAGADVFARRLGLTRLHVLDAAGELLATLARRGESFTIHPPTRRPRDPAVSLALLRALGSRVSRGLHA